MEKFEILENLVTNYQELSEVLFNQVIDLTMMSKIELGDDVIEFIRELKEQIKNLTEELNK